MFFENPFLTPPQAESPQSRSWGQGFAAGFQEPLASLMTPADAEDSDAFQQGVGAGQQAATEGLSFMTDPCVDLNRESGPSGFELAGSGFEAIMVGRDLFIKAFSGAALGAVVGLLNLSIALETFFDDPQEAISSRAQKLQSLLNNMGITDSMELFIGGAVDLNARGCELKLTPVFRSESSARAAAESFGRSSLLVVSWRTDQSGGIKLVDFVQ